MSSTDIGSKHVEKLHSMAMHWKKWLVRIFGALALLLVVAVFGVWLALKRISDGLCYTMVYDRALSPDGKHQAIVFEIDCGATTGFNRHVAIAPAKLDVDQQNVDLPESFLFLQGEHSIKLNWKASSRLAVSYPAEAKVVHRQPVVDGVLIEYSHEVHD